MEPTYIEQQESYIAELRTRCASAEAALATMIEQKEYFRQCWEAAEAALAERDKPCVWRRADDGFFETGCNAPRYTSRAPKFCQNCGHPVEVQP